MTGEDKNIFALGDIRVKVPKSFLSQSYESVCSDHPLLFTPKSNVMQTGKRRNNFEQSEFTRNYWRRIYDDLIRDEEIQKRECEPKHIHHYIVRTIELYKTDE